MKRPLIHAPYKGVHPYFEILRFKDEKPPKDFHFFILTRTSYIIGSKNQDDLPTTSRLHCMTLLEYRYCLQTKSA